MTGLEHNPEYVQMIEGRPAVAWRGGGVMSGRRLGHLLPVGPRSVLFGAHQFVIHPAFVLAAWVRLYGWPRHPAYYVAFFVHDLGYLGQWCRNMDGPEGEQHPLFGARIMTALFDRGRPKYWIVEAGGRTWELGWWGAFVFLHSRFLARRNGMPFSRLCVADKFSIGLTPRWLYLPLVLATGEIWEYMHRADERRDAGEKTLHGTRMAGSTPGQWHSRVREHMTAWALEHADGREDTWTPTMGTRRADDVGVWQ